MFYITCQKGILHYVIKHAKRPFSTVNLVNYSAVIVSANYTLEKSIVYSPSQSHKTKPENITVLTQA